MHYFDPPIRRRYLNVHVKATSIFNLVNWVPVINVPTGRGANYVPTGLQVAAAPYDDVGAATVASAYAENAEPFFEGILAPDFRHQVRG